MTQSKWYDFQPNSYASKAKSQRILNFYVFSCPVEGVNIQSKKINEYGWNTPVLKRSLSGKLKNLITDKHFKIAKNALEFDEILQSNKVLNTMGNICESVLLTSDQTNISELLFRTIRNSFAHGAFLIKMNKKELYYILENRNNGKLKARMIVKEETLLKWIDILKNKK